MNNKKHTVWVVWGALAVNQFNNGFPVSTLNREMGYAKKYEFDTIKEREAFIKGIKESRSWMDARILQETEIEIQGNNISEKSHAKV